jgi:hypothetical protein
MGIFRITIRNTISQTESGATTVDCTGVTLMAGLDFAPILRGIGGP